MSLKKLSDDVIVEGIQKSYTNATALLDEADTKQYR